MSEDNGAVEPTMRPPASGVTVRLYNTGFGDCLLLAFRAGDGSARYMLIDCGVHHLYPDGDERMQQVSKDIAEATGNHLHVVMATHEHTDHLYGFKHGRETFEDIEIDELWLAWTEDPTDPVAQELKQLYGMRIRALTEAVSLLRAADGPLASKLQGVLGFEFPDALSATGGKAAQLDYLREKSKKKLQRPEDYCRPGEVPLTLPDVSGVRIYVLGPPQDVDWIKKLHKTSELYPELAAVDEAVAFAASALAAGGTDSLDDDDRQLFRRSCPFDESFEISSQKARADAESGSFFRRHYGFSNRRGHGPAWRRIDADWLAPAEQLALDVNSKTNNTSLVLAIELADTQPRKVLLFAADAQVGNWLSWHQLSWPGDSADDDRVTAADLLRRTVLYKVGHHGSRNATLSEKGLEMMESADLVAMIPVDQNWANEVMDWEHPAEKLLKRIEEKSRGRIVRTDQIPGGDEPPTKPAQATEEEWGAFVAQLDWDRGPRRLWIQYTVSGQPPGQPAPCPPPDPRECD
jgi:hypothetical protein